MNKLSERVAVVTGAGSGIGRALALGLAQEGCRLAVADVNEEGLRETARLVEATGGTVVWYRVDVSRREQVYAFAEEVVRHYGQVHLVINNAGVGLSETVEDTTYEDFHWIMDINFWGTVHTTKAFLPHLKTVPDAQLVNVASILGLVGIAAQAAYSAGKFAIRGLTESLQQEWRGSSLTISCAYPGGTRTNIARSARFYKSMDGVTTREMSVERFEAMAPLSPEQVARAIIRGIKRRRERIVIGPDTRLMDALQRLFPSFYDRILAVIVSTGRTLDILRRRFPGGKG